MAKQTKQQKLAKLLKQTAEAQHQALIKVNGEDKAWPEWYAKYLFKNGIMELLQPKGKD